MKFYTNSTSNLNSTITFSGNVGIGTTPPSQRLTINSNGWASIGNPNPSAKLHVYSEYHEELEKRFFQIAILLARNTKIDPESLNSIYKCLHNIGYDNDEIIASISKAEKILSDIGSSRELRISVMDLFIFCASHIIKHQRENDYIKIFEPLDA